MAMSKMDGCRLFAFLMSFTKNVWGNIFLSGLSRRAHRFTAESASVNFCQISKSATFEVPASVWSEKWLCPRWTDVGLFLFLTSFMKNAWGNIFSSRLSRRARSFTAESAPVIFCQISKSATFEVPASVWSEKWLCPRWTDVGLFLFLTSFMKKAWGNICWSGLSRRARIFTAESASVNFCQIYICRTFEVPASVWSEKWLCPRWTDVGLFLFLMSFMKNAWGNICWSGLSRRARIFTAESASVNFCHISKSGNI
jgi:hypothetical protein